MRCKAKFRRDFKCKVLSDASRPRAKKQTCAWQYRRCCLHLQRYSAESCCIDWCVHRILPVVRFLDFRPSGKLGFVVTDRWSTYFLTVACKGREKLVEARGHEKSIQDESTSNHFLWCDGGGACEG